RVLPPRQSSRQAAGQSNVPPKAAPEIGRNFAADAEGGVERAIAVETFQREGRTSAGRGGPTPHHKLPIGLYRYGACEIGGHFTTSSEGGVERDATLRLDQCWGKHHHQGQ